jgi:hypothetical protein
MEECQTEKDVIDISCKSLRNPLTKNHVIQVNTTNKDSHKPYQNNMLLTVNLDENNYEFAQGS